MATKSPAPATKEGYTIGWICALSLELTAAKAVLDQTYPALPQQASDNNIYTYGRIGAHNIVVTCISEGAYGTTSATLVASQLRSSFPSLKFCLMVGVG